MPKTIIPIGNDPKLNIIKAFRIANKRAGEAKRAGPTELENYLRYCAAIRELKDQAETLGFHLFILNGKTGHTYEFDYKETPDTQNDYEAFQQTLLRRRDTSALSPTEPIIPEPAAPEETPTQQIQEGHITRPDLVGDEDDE